jgi:sugar/nucleoside kinase (ribokinase family)
MKSKFFVIGNVSKDQVLYDGGERATFWGGSGLNIAVSASRLGMNPILVSVVGEDALELLSQVKDRIDVSSVKVVEGETCRFDIRYSADGTLKRIDSKFNAAGCLNDYLQGLHLAPGHYHVSCRRPLRPGGLLSRIAGGGYPFSLDFILSSVSEQLADAKEWIADAEHIFMNSQEFEILESSYDLEDFETIIVTSGSQPVRAIRFGEVVLRQVCVRKDFLDVTGAGDTFIGAFLASQLKGEALFRSVKRGVLSAQASLDSFGALDLLT